MSLLVKRVLSKIALKNFILLDKGTKIIEEADREGVKVTYIYKVKDNEGAIKILKSTHLYQLGQKQMQPEIYWDYLCGRI